MDVGTTHCQRTEFLKKGFMHFLGSSVLNRSKYLKYE